MIKNEPLVAEIINCGCGREEVVQGSGTGAGLLQHMGVSAEERLRHRAGQRNMLCDLYFAHSLLRLLCAYVEEQRPQLLWVWSTGGEHWREMCGRNLVERIAGKLSFSHIRNPDALS